MKVAWLFLVVVVVVCLTYESEAWRVRVRRFRIRRVVRGVGRGVGRVVRKVGRGVGRVVKAIVCCWYCPRVCRFGVCKFACRRVCRRGKREAIANIQGHVAPMPDSFISYDTDRDGFISIEELAREVNEEPTASDFIEAFQAADKNGDGKLSREEFYDGPFVLEMDVEEEDEESERYMRQRMVDDDDDIEDLEDDSEEIDPEWTGEGIDESAADDDGAEEQAPTASPTNSTHTESNAQPVL